MLLLRALPLAFLLFSSCNRGVNNSNPQAVELKSISLRVPGADPWKVYGTLWQRTFPEEYKELKAQAQEMREGGGDPFADPSFDVPDDELTPYSFTRSETWARGLPWKVFRELGYPVSINRDPNNGDTNAKLFWSHSTGIFEIYHSSEAIAAFRKRFPEFQPVSKTGGEQGESLKP